MNLDPPESPRAPGGDPALFFTGGVKAGFSRWQEALDGWLDWFGVGQGKRDRLLRCGQGMTIRVCSKCGVEDRDTARRTADCDLRTCPRCGRTRAQERRECIRAATERLQPYKNGSWHLHTIPVPRDLEAGTTIARLRQDFDAAWSAWRALWRHLRTVGAQIAYVSAECAPGGLVHVHAMVWHPYQRGAAFARLRDIVIRTLRRRGYLKAAIYHLAKVASRGKGLMGAIKEVAKYVTKGVAVEEHDRAAYNAPDCEPWQTHPALCAQIELAWKGRRTWRVYGVCPPAERETPAEPKWSCPNCGHKEHTLRFELPINYEAQDLTALIRALALAGHRH